MNDMLEIRGLQKGFGNLSIIRGLDISVMEGERHAVIGPNGAGKSTLFHLISGLHKPDGGDILLKGRSIAGLKPHLINRRGLGRSFQITNIFPGLSVYENVRLGAMGSEGFRYSLLRRASMLCEVNQKVDGILERVRLARFRNRLAGDLAYSDQRALEIALTLSTDPDLIVLDEPMAGMSTEETGYMVDLIRKVTEGKTLMVVEHDMGVVFSLCDRISVLVYGQIIATGTPDEIRANKLVQQAYLGDDLFEAAS